MTPLFRPEEREETTERVSRLLRDDLCDRLEGPLLEFVRFRE
jgi:hypothetical protein